MSSHGGEGSRGPSGAGVLLMDEQTTMVSYETDGSRVWLTIRNEPRSNALSAAVIEGLTEGLLRADRSGARCVLITGSGDRAFCAGADLTEIMQRRSTLDDPDLFGLFELVERCRPIVIAVVQGMAVGGGFELALCADLVIAAEEARFSLPETSLGLAPGIALIRLHHFLGRHLAKELALTTKELTAAQLLDFRVINRVVPRSELQSAAESIAADVEHRAPLAAQLVKEGFNRELGGDDWGFVRERMGTLWTSQDLKEGLAAFRERRAAEFRGR